jgi:Bacterial PH domain
MEYDARVWRIRRWIRLASVLVLAGLLAQYADTVRRVTSGQMPGTEARDGLVGLAVVASVVWRCVFHPRVQLSPDGQVTVRNPLRQRRFAAADVIDFSFTGFGLAFHLADGQRPVSFVFQDTRHWSEPRWFQVAEAITGHKPELPPDEEWDED